MDYQAVGNEELVRLVREGAPDAFPELSARYLWLVRAQVRLFEGPSAPEREDLLQEGFLGLFAAAASFSQEGGASFSTYAAACVRNRMTSAMRRHRSLKNRPLNESVPLDSADAAAVAAAGPEDLLELRDQLQRLQKRLEAALTPMERKALSLYLSGCRRGDVDRFGMSLKAFDNALYRVREKLKRESL